MTLLLSLLLSLHPVDTTHGRITVVPRVHSWAQSKTFDGYRVGKVYYCSGGERIPKKYKVVKFKPQ